MDWPSEHGQMITEPLLSNRKGGIRTLPFILGTHYLCSSTQAYLSNLVIIFFLEFCDEFSIF
jgi:peptide/histidine transporter 3/4